MEDYCKRMFCLFICLPVLLYGFLVKTTYAATYAETGTINKEEHTLTIQLLADTVFEGKTSEYEFIFKAVNAGINNPEKETDERNETIIKIVALDDEAKNAWDDATKLGEIRSSGYKYEEALDTSGWVMMYSTLYYEHVGQGTDTEVFVSHATFGYDRGQPTIVVNSIATSLANTNIMDLSQSITTYPSMGSNVPYTLYAPSNWHGININTMWLFVGCSIDMSFSRNSSTWQSSCPNVLYMS